MKKNCIVAQSGGPTAAINASLAGVLYAAGKSEKIEKAYCGINGIEGILKEDIVLMEEFIKEDGDIDRLKITPASFLGSCRYKLDKDISHSDYIKVFEILKRLDIGYFFYIGGNDSMDTVDKLNSFAKSKGADIKFIGIPKTIDNDLDETDHTPGFGSAAKYIATSVMEISLDSYVYAKNAVTIIEVMGRNAGWLTASAALARQNGLDAPHLIYLPERAFENKRFISDIHAVFEKGVHSVVVVISEGIRYENGSYVCDSKGDAKDVFGNPLLSGAGKVLENIVRAQIGCKVRSVEINVLQRCGGHITSKTDIDESFEIGKQAVLYAQKGDSGRMMVFVRTADDPYEIAIESRNISKVALVEKIVPDAFINEAGNDVTGRMTAYLKPLIQGNVEVQFKNGLPDYLIR